MSFLEFDLFRVFITKKKKYFYFIQNMKNNFMQSKGMDLSSSVYMLMFKNREYKCQHQEYVKMLKNQDFDFENKPYFDKNIFEKLISESEKDENYLFKNWDTEIDINQIDENNEMKALSYISTYNPRRNFYNGYSTLDVHEALLVKVLCREVIIDKILSNLKNKIKGSEQVKISDIVELEDMKILLLGPNGDLWLNLFLSIETIDKKSKYCFLYKITPSKLLDNRQHLNDPEYVKCAIDGLKFNHQKLTDFFKNLPKSIQTNIEILSFYDWHRECSL